MIHFYLKRIFKLKNFLVLVGFIWLVHTKREYDRAVEINNELSKYSKSDSFMQRISKTNYVAKQMLYYVGIYDTLPILYVISPCQTEILTELADLNRLKNTLYLVPKLVWIFVENKPQKSSKLAQFIAESELEAIHLNRDSNLEIDLMNEGLEWLRNNYKNPNGVVYFAKPQGSYDIINLYEHMIRTKSVTVWPVGFAKNSLYQRPVCVQNKIVSWNCAGNCTKKDLIDLSGFSMHIQLLISSNIYFKSETYLDFILGLVSFDKIEPVKIENCTRILAWNTRTYPAIIHYKSAHNKSYDENMLNQI